MSSPSPLERVRALGLAIEKEWREASYSRDSFPELAVRAIERAALHEHISPDEILSWALATSELPTQADPKARFGEPPITLYVGRKFYIDALFWVDGTTSIHQHAFNGAFQVLAGSSIHTSYTFAPTRTVGHSMTLGELTATGSKLLKVGDVHPIHGGKALIHALFHLQRPSVSLVVRTPPDGVLQPQYSYLAPGLAYDPFLEEPWSMRLVQIAKMLQKIDHPRAEAMIGDAIDGSDARTCFFLLESVRSVPDRRVFDRLIARAGARHPAIAPALAAVFAEIAREDSIVEKRRQVHDAEQRFFLALLLNVRSRKGILRLAGEYASDRDAVDTVLSWLVALSKITVKLQLGGAPWEPNAFGLPELDDAALRGIAQRLRGEEIDAIEDPKVRAIVATIARLPTFRHLFSE